MKEDVLNWLLAIIIITFLFFLLGMFKIIKQMIEDEREAVDLYKQIHLIDNAEDWIKYKHRVVGRIHKRFKKNEADDRTTGSLYGALADKAEQLLTRV